MTEKKSPRLIIGIQMLTMGKILTLFALLVYLLVFALPGKAYGAGRRPVSFLWPSEPPDDCPFEKSDTITGIFFTGKHAEYTYADTWYCSWASDGNMYSPWTDGSIGNMSCNSAVGEKARTGHAKIIGNDPRKLKVIPLGTYNSSALPYGGRYPCGSLVHNDIWYYGTYCLDNEDDSYYNWGILGPFVGFRISRDFGKTWTETPHTPANPLFKEPKIKHGKVKIGAPHFVDFGQNMQHSPDGKAYLIAHGASDPDPKPRKANLSWISGDEVYLIRVKPTIENINDISKYEFFAGHDLQGQPVWTQDFSMIKPLFEWNNRTGCVTMTYNEPLKKYLMCVTDGWPTVETMRTYILESDNITGSWKLVTFMRDFGEQAYFVNIPSKFIGSDGRTAWLCYSANFAGERRDSYPRGSVYALCLQQIKLFDAEMYRQYNSPGTTAE